MGTGGEKLLGNSRYKSCHISGHILNASDVVSSLRSFSSPALPVSLQTIKGMDSG